jgi:hypothetical protein
MINLDSPALTSVINNKDSPALAPVMINIDPPALVPVMINIDSPAQPVYCYDQPRFSLHKF